ncbi:MAG TPA: DegV family protein [Anaerolineae bacterium]|nr:DegV family protein [Anaerolineae bacterium]HOR01494.1 DegV family protein [Anaerolineae bacterium]HPL30735.1 DegV family protein [Anaerolineae bacterium]
MSVDPPPRIVTDSTADIPADVARRLDITVIPCQIHVQGCTYLDGIDITRRELFDHLRRGDAVSTSQPAVGIFAETYRRALASGRRVIAIHLGSGFSGLYGTACVAAREVDSERIAMIDSRQVSMATGWLAILAAEAAQQGLGLGQVLARVRQALSKLRLFALIDDLRFVHRGGRIGWVSSMVGQLLAIKPIVLVRNNRVDLSEKVRSRLRGIDRLVALAGTLGHIERLAVLHADDPAGLADLSPRLSGLVPQGSMLATEAGAIVCAHAGPGALGFACVLR